jgi:hypothetical protein
VTDQGGITVNAGGNGSFTFNDVRLEEGHLLYTFSPGNDFLTCDLAPREGGGILGDCIDEAGGAGKLVMRRPVSAMGAAMEDDRPALSASVMVYVQV